MGSASPPPTPSTPPPAGDDGRARDESSLVVHLQFVRRLARSLVRGEAAADDLAQETFALALERPPRANFEWRGWLAGIARRLAWRARRGDERRARRERDGATRDDGHAPSAVETAALLELSRRVVDEVARLDEPYATTLRRRFLDGLDATAIARLEGIPVETVRTRVKRALARLRERLDARHGGDRENWAGLLGTLAGGAVMGTKAKIALAAGVVVLLGWFASVLVPPPPPEPSAPRRLAAAANVVEPPLPGDQRESDAAVAQGAAPAVRRDPIAANAADSPLGRVLHGRVTDPAGTAVRGLWLTLSAVESIVEPRTRPIPDDGSFAFSGLAPGVWYFSISAHEGYEPIHQQVRVAEAPQVQRVDFVLEPSQLVAIRLRTPEGERLVDRLEAKERPRVWRGLSLRATVEPPPRELPPDETAKHRLAGFVYSSAELGELGARSERLDYSGEVDAHLVVPQRPIHVAAYYKHLLLDSAYVEAEGREATLRIAPEAIEELLATVTLRFVDADTRAPLRYGHVELADVSTSASVAVDPGSGVVRFERVAPGHLRLQRWNDDHEAYDDRVVIEPGATVDLGDLAVARCVPVSIRLVDEAGRAVKGIVRQFALAGPGAEHSYENPISYHLGVSGSVGELPFGRVRAVVIASTDDRDSPRLESRPVVVDAASGLARPVELVLRSATRGRIEVAGQPVDESLRMAAPLWIEIVGEDGIAVRRRRSSGRSARIEWLPQGRYELVARCAGNVVASAPFVVGGEPFRARLEWGAPQVAAPVESILETRPSSIDAGHGPAVAASRSGTLLFGALRDSSGAPVVARQVSAVDGAGARRQGDCGVDGSYVVDGLAAGECELIVRGLGVAEQRARVRVEAVAAQQHDLELRRVLRVPVRFLAPDGRPLADALAALGREGRPLDLPLLGVVPSDAPLASVAPPQNGRRRATERGRFDPEPDDFSFGGMLEVEGELPFVANVVVGREVLESRVVAEPLEEFLVTVDPQRLLSARATVSWHVVDAESGASLQLESILIGSTGGEGHVPAARHRTDDGRYTLLDLEPGERSLGFGADGYEPIRRRIDLPAGRTTDLGAIALSRTVTIAGRLVDHDGAPVRARLRAVAAERPVLPWVGREVARFGGEVDGNFEFTGAGHRSYWIALADERFAWRAWRVDATNGERRGLEFVAERGTRVAIEIASGSWRLFALELLDSDGDFVGSSTVQGGSPLRLELRPGSYSIVISEQGESRGMHELRVAEEPVTRTIALE